ncbi:cation:proton antiporter [Lentzea nigeriaca]|uniref:cation:proton antiporter n=1 Tax=Lentzea nigeriaca TaxID=1128665 RepID=UPI00195C6347|nr:cation:proton antiporter [Lentzea nigeriaca]MBM7863816.1 NhaP-type Na+/H+ or K+/H+ antiporter [Lentzea nigeriaca]
MNSFLLAIALAIAVRSLAAGRLDRWNLGAPIIMVVAGVVVGLLNDNSINAVLNTETVQYVAEIILAVLLFVDATEVRAGRFWGNWPGVVARLLFLALPLSLGAAMLVGWALFPGLPWPVLLLIAGVVVPIDFAPAERVVRDRGLSAKVRSVLNVEGGYNDGIVSPLFLFALLMAGDVTQERTPLEALATVVPFALKALLVGIVVGSLLAWLMDRAQRAGWLTDQSGRVIVLLAPLTTYALTALIDGNGFVASFVCGIAFRYVHRTATARRIRQTATEHNGASSMHENFRLLEDVTSVLMMLMWFVVGIAAVLVYSNGVSWQVLLFCAAVLTVVRMVPVHVSLLGSTLSQRERLLVGALGPRGTTSIVFGLLAFNKLPSSDAADTILLITVTCVLGSVLLHGLGAGPLVRRVKTTGAVHKG